MLKELELEYIKRTGNTVEEFYHWMNEVFYLFPGKEDSEVFKLAKELLP